MASEAIAAALPISGLLYPSPAFILLVDGIRRPAWFPVRQPAGGWGYLVMRRRLAKLGVQIDALSPLNRLALVGDQGRGAP